MPPAAVAGGSAALGALGSYMGAKSQADAASDLANAPVKIPQDVQLLRKLMAGRLKGMLPNAGDYDAMSEMPDFSNMENMLNLINTPGFYNQIAGMFDPTSIMQGIYEGGLGAVKTGIDQSQAAARAALGASGNLWSTDIARVFGDIGSRAHQQWGGQVAGLAPGLYGTMASALSGIPSAMAGTAATGINALLQPKGMELSMFRAPYELATPLATAGVGGTASASLAPYMGQSPMGSAFGTAGNVLSMYPLMQSVMGPTTTSPVAPTYPSFLPGGTMLMPGTG